MTEGRREDGDRAGTGRRLSVAEAASELGTTSEGVRSRIKRGTLQAERASGRVWVILEGAPPRTGAAPPQPDAAPPGDRAGDTTELVDELRARVSSLERQLDLERDANRENRRLLAAALEHIPALEAPTDEPEPPETGKEEPESVEPLTDPGRPQLSSIFIVLSWIGVGSIPILVRSISEAQAPVWLILSPLSLFVVPFIFGLYRGVWLRKRQEFDQTAGSSQQGEFVGTVGFRETKVALATGGGSAFVTIFMAVLGGGWAFEFVSALLVFVGSFLFFVFAVLIGSATGGQEGRHDTSHSQTRGGGLRAAAWWNPQLILGLIATIITAAATVFAAFLAG